MGAITTAVSLALQGGAMIAQSRAQARAARANRQFARQAEADVRERGEQEIAAYGRQLSQVQGQQRVGLAAQGIDLGQGTAAEIARQTEQIGQQDVQTIRRNIEREAWGIRTQADINYRAGMAQSQASTLQALGSFAQFGTAITTPNAQGQTLLGRAGRAVGSGWNAVMRGTNPLTTMAGVP